MSLQQSCVSPRQAVFRQQTNRLEQCRTDLIVQIFRRKLALPGLKQPFAYRGGKFGHMSGWKCLERHHERLPVAWVLVVLVLYATERCVHIRVMRLKPI